MTSVGAVICAGGKGSRAGFDKNKLLVPLFGERVLEKTLRAFDCRAVHEIVVACAEEDFAEVTEICSAYPKAKVVLGGATRGESVYNALQAINTDIVLIHDGARPFVTRTVIERCIASVKAFGSGICAVPATDTVALCEGDRIESVPARANAYLIQTPQGFYKENILYAYARALECGNTQFTDDSSLFATYCGKPRICEGAIENVKLTYASDFERAFARVGHGVDTHAFGKAQNYITLGGVKIPSESGLIAHSDGDVLVHAVMDALLSASGLRDIGFYFPDTDPKWKNANSMEMLTTVVELVEKQGFRTQNVSISVQAERPRLSPYIEDMKNTLARALRIDPTAVGITAGTNEGLGYVGEGKGITVYAGVLLAKK
jgi:2-C-methyl-D-erythritol 2,4-cyclodiphosphate synthase/2-C-methyl-D-erythritol 4-phosphate cytidylyltransferase